MGIIFQHQPHNNNYYLHYTKSLNLDRYTDNSRGSPVLVGSVNGLIACCRPDGCICILNPVLEEYIVLPRPTINYWYPKFYGFGVSKGGEYKVIRITGRTEVYTLGTPAWRDLGERTYPIQQRGHMFHNRADGVFLNGHVYSLCGREIYDFDLDTETLELFPISPLVYAGFKDLILGVLKGRLSLVSWSSYELEVWVMKEGNWCKEILGMLMFGLQSWRPLRLMDGLKGTCNLMLCDQGARKLMVWCLDTRTIQQVEMQGKSGELMVYRPSFIKLDNFVSRPCELRKVYEYNVRNNSTY
ncbi:F-box/kelch-repeat protein At3g06240-like [Bidens hawaiensis]|uniref:F-box/kelch-repeat protein At3g06240-like n=1 Tax=Bidens hawaiensis TaxID=980011 RepID=UPI0040498B68